MPGFDTWHKPLDGDVVGFADAWGEDVFPDWLPVELRPFNVVRLSQSFIEGWRKCPSSAVAEKRPTYGEAAAAGIVARSITDGRITHQAKTPEIDDEWEKQKLDELAAHGWTPPEGPDFHEKCVAYADVFTNIYIDKYHQYMPNIETEASGLIIWDIRSDPTTDVDFVLISGTADLLITDGVRKIGVDWKSGAKMPEPWMVQRYGVQWRVYAVMFELDEMIFHYPMAFEPLNGNKGDWVATRYRGVVRVYANRLEREAYKRQLLHEVTPIASALLRSQEPEDHVIRPDNWHCSAKWCQRFAAGECIGQDVNLVWVAKSLTEAATHVGAIKIPTQQPATTAGDTNHE